jgi:hypothetical protein
MAAVGLQVAQVRQREQVATRRGAGEARALRGQRGVQTLAFGVETLQHRQPFGHAFDEVGLRDVHGIAPHQVLRGDRALRTMIAQTPHGRVALG